MQETMKHIFLSILTISIVLLIACEHNNDGPVSIYEYHAHIHQPDSLAKNIGDTLEIEVEFESHTGQTIHHINVRIYDKATNAEVYNKPDEAHVHDSSGAYTFEDQFILSAANGLSAGDWILEAKVWGEADGEEETSEQVEFHIN